MVDATGEAKHPPLRVAVDRRIRLELHGARITSDYGRLAGYEDVNDAARLARDPAMRTIVGRGGMDGLARLRISVTSSCGPSRLIIIGDAASLGS